MATRDYFKNINFDGIWNEQDWERFFQAQDRLLREEPIAASRAAGRGRVDPGLSFRGVLRRFGMDPDGGAASLDLWVSPVESLPIYGRSQSYARRVTILCEAFFARMLLRRQKKTIHRFCHYLLGNLLDHASRAAAEIAQGHGLGYAPDRVNGNVARCKRALRHADACLGILSRFPRRRLGPGKFKPLFRETLRLRNDLMGWIAFLRAHLAKPGTSET